MSGLLVRDLDRHVVDLPSDLVRECVQRILHGGRDDVGGLHGPIHDSPSWPRRPTLRGRGRLIATTPSKHEAAQLVGAPDDQREGGENGELRRPERRGVKMGWRAGT